MDERRREPRLQQWLPVQVGGAKQALGVVHNASRRGMLMMATMPFEVGDQLELSIQNPKTSETVVIPGKVVRVGPNQGDPDGMWRYAVALEFDEPQDALEQLVRELSGKSGDDE
jgi:Tfp pilus assembly protein PilZ